MLDQKKKKWIVKELLQLSLILHQPRGLPLHVGDNNDVLVSVVTIEFPGHTGVFSRCQYPGHLGVRGPMEVKDTSDSERWLTRICVLKHAVMARRIARRVQSFSFSRISLSFTYRIRGGMQPRKASAAERGILGPESIDQNEMTPV